MKNNTGKNRRIWNIVCVVLVVAVMVYLLKDLYDTNFNLYETMTADEIVQQDVIPMKAFIVRDEEYIDGKSSGTVVPLVADGKRVASGDSVAIVCKSADDAADYAALNEAMEEKARYEALSGHSDINTVDIQKLNVEIEKSYSEFLRSAGTRSYTDLSSDISELEDKLAEKQIITEENIDFSDKIAASDKKIAELEAKKINPDNVEAPLSGYYVSNLDGFENTVDYSGVKNITVSQVNKALDASARNVSGKMGKIVGSYKWYMISTVDSKYAKVLPVGKKMNINLPFYGIEGISVTIESVSAESDGQIAVALSCTLMDEVYANMRTVDAELIMKEYTGYKIPSTSVRTIKTEDGGKINVVYILRGDIMSARVVDILYTPKDGDYIVASSETKDVLDDNTKKPVYKAIQRYDEVIVKGRNLENGKSIG